MVVEAHDAKGHAGDPEEKGQECARCQRDGIGRSEANQPAGEQPIVPGPGMVGLR